MCSVCRYDWYVSPLNQTADAANIGGNLPLSFDEVPFSFLIQLDACWSWLVLATNPIIFRQTFCSIGR